MKHEPFRHEHPRRTLALRTRTKMFGTWNFAVALGGRSCGWGTCDHPRRTFVGHVPRPNPDRGLYFAKVVVARGHRERVLLRVGRHA